MDQQERISANFAAIFNRLLFPRAEPSPPSINDLIASLHNFEVISHELGDGYASTYRFMSNVFAQIRDHSNITTEREAYAVLQLGLMLVRQS